MMLKLRIDELLDEAGTNLYASTVAADISHSTMHRYRRSPTVIKRLDVHVVAAFLISGLDMTPDELAKRPFGEIFDILTNEQVAALEAERKHLDSIEDDDEA